MESARIPNEIKEQYTAARLRPLLARMQELINVCENRRTSPYNKEQAKKELKRLSGLK